MTSFKTQIHKSVPWFFLNPNRLDIFDSVTDTLSNNMFSIYLDTILANAIGL